MGLQLVPAYMGASGFQHPVELDRNILERVGGGGRTGLLRVGDFKIAPTATAQQFSIAAGAAILVGPESAQQGAYFVWSDVSENKLLGTPSGSPRIDTVLLRVEDDQYGTIPGARGAYWDIVAGTPSGSPVARPDSDFFTGGPFYIPGAWLRGADIRVNPGDTTIPGGQIVESLRYTRQGGYTLCTSASRPTDAVMGDRIYETDTKLRWVYDGAAWTLQPTILSTQTLGSAAASVTFSSIPSSIKRLELHFVARTDPAVTNQVLNLRINGASSADYFWNEANISNVTQGNTVAAATQAQIGHIFGASAGSGQFTVGVIDLIGWNAPHAKLNWEFKYYGYDTAANSFYGHGGGLFNLAGPYTSITLLPGSGNFITLSEFVLKATA